MLEIRDFSKSYTEGKPAVERLSFSVPDGQITGFIGHNGAGKTTTLRCVAGILSFTQGQILIGGHDVRKEPVAAKRITAFLPDNPELYDFMTGIKYLKLVADLYRIPDRERTEQIERIAESYEMTGVLGSPISSYSHGMKQKLALISALMRKPRLLLLDEPFVGLDPSAAFITKEYLKEICAQGGSVLFSTHVLEVAEKLCDRIAIIRKGQLVEEGPTDRIVGKEGLEAVFMELSEEKREGKEEQRNA
ncbi:MAG: ABC transporter ATP-binding protein [Eubacteriales bacterium]|nr:ABC transporter ATP-binding protein [Eubacteriales bacterium]